MLHMIFDALGLEFNLDNCEVIAKDLSQLVCKKPPWSAKYIYSIYRGDYEPSKKLVQAIESLSQTIDGSPAGIAGSIYVKVLAQPGQIGEGALIPRTAITIKCARPGCAVWFVKTHPCQKYHDRECRKDKR